MPLSSPHWLIDPIFWLTPLAQNHSRTTKHLLHWVADLTGQHLHLESSDWDSGAQVLSCFVASSILGLSGKELLTRSRVELTKTAVRPSPVAKSIIPVSSGQNPVLEIKTIFEVEDGLLMLQKNLDDPWLTTQVFKTSSYEEEKSFLQYSGDQVCVSL